MSLRTLDSALVAGKKVLLRVDFNVPLENGKVSDDTRIREALPTIRELLEKGAALIVCSHLGRPKGKPTPEFSLAPVADRFEELLGKPVKRAKSVVGTDALEMASGLQKGEILLLENTRFEAGEEENSVELSAKLASMADLFVSDAFGTVHRAHASTEGVAHLLPSFAGRLVEKEVAMLENVFQNPKKPLVAIIGGAKIDTKIGILKNFVGKADFLIIGGGLANTFLGAQGFGVGKSLSEPDSYPLAQEILAAAEAKGTKILLPSDCGCGKEFSPDAPRHEHPVSAIEEDDQILDIGSSTIVTYDSVLKKAGMVLWNGPVGVTEFPNFAAGTRSIADTIATLTVPTILGGGDTVEAIHKFGLGEERFTHVSTGGGAMLEFLEGKVLPGIAVLES